MTSTQEKVECFEKKIGVSRSHDFINAIRSASETLISETNHVFMDDEERCDYITHVFAMILDETMDSIEYGPSNHAYN